VTPHDLRRSAATNLALAGVAEQVAMQILGHRTPGTYRRYRIGQAEDMLQAGAGLTAYLQKPTAAPGTSGN
jgi:integrase